MTVELPGVGSPLEGPGKEPGGGAVAGEVAPLESRARPTDGSRRSAEPEQPLPAWVLELLGAASEEGNDGGD